MEQLLCRISSSSESVRNGYLRQGLNNGHPLVVYYTCFWSVCERRSIGIELSSIGICIGR